jgi:formamidopyrimidine-DNA glycosylase
MPELPEVETTRRGIGPLAVGHRVAALRIYDRRLRWPVPAALEQAVAGRTIDGPGSAKAPAFRVGAHTSYFISMT